jgi:putative tryptophan/tyrosine transport system substrate-binding protein
MRRRELITLLGGAAAAWPLVARAQQRVPVVGYLGVGWPESDASDVAAFRKGLSEAGFVEGRNVAIEYRWAEAQNDRLPVLAADLVRSQVAVINVRGPVAARAARAASSSIPIVFGMGEDPVKEGIVASLNRPGANVTGFTDFANQLASKRLGLLHEIVPMAAVFGFLVNPTNPNAEPDTRDVQAAANATGRELRALAASSDRDLETAFATMVQQRVGGLIVNIDSFFTSRLEKLVALAALHAIPAIYDRRDFPAAGGLMSYGTDRSESIRQCGIYVGRILKGENPGDLPVQQSTKFAFVINLRTAKAMDVAIPPGVLAIVDEVIE